MNTEMDGTKSALDRADQRLKEIKDAIGSG
jgi:hypothetical protein